MSARPPLADASPCSSCRTLPDLGFEDGTLYLCPADADLHAALADAGAAAAPAGPGVLAVPLAAGLIDRLAAAGDRWAAVRAAVVPPGILPTPAALMTARPLAELFGQARGRWLADVLRDNRLTVHFQPIVSAADPAAVHGHECLLRGTAADGELIPPGRLFAAAGPAGLLFHLDRAARVAAVRAAAARLPAGRVFVNFRPASIYNPAVCLRTTYAAAAAAGLDPARVVFEVVESEEVRETQHLLDLLAEYRRAGFKVALDDVGAGYSSLNLLARLRPDYVKIDMGLVRGVDADPYKAEVVGRLIDMCRGLGVAALAEGVETAAEWRWLRDRGADLAQGYLFARPAEVPPAPRVP